MNNVYVIGGARTPIGKTGGILKDFLPEQLAALVLNATIQKFALPVSEIDHVIMGNACGPGGNIARVSLLAAGWPYDIPGTTIDFQCGSGLGAITIAIDQIAAGQADLILAGGTESTSMAPRRQFNLNDPRFKGDGFFKRAPFSTPAIGDPEMCQGAENLARLMDIARKDMDRFALESHQRAYRTQIEGILKEIILPVHVGGKVIYHDESIRPEINLKLLERMPPVVFRGGMITAGNACLTHDGAAVVLLASEKAVARFDLKPEAVMLNHAYSGCDPNVFPLGPVSSIKKLAAKSAMIPDDADAVEINEAFAVKVLTCCRELNLALEKTNILGGALAYGHPYGASGAVILLHLIKALKKINGRRGIATLGAAGGQGIAVLVERC